MEEPFDRSELGKLVRREPAAIERWFRAHADAVFTFAYYRAGRDAELARDVVQDTFLAAIGRLHRYDGQQERIVRRWRENLGTRITPHR